MNKKLKFPRISIFIICLFFVDILYSQNLYSFKKNVSIVKEKQDDKMCQQSNTLSNIVSINDPVLVSIPPSDAASGLVRLENGEVRHYDYGNQPTNGILHYSENLPTKYIFSRDNGLTWKTKLVPKDHWGADFLSPISGEHMRLVTKNDGVYLIKTQGGLDGQYTIKRIWETPVSNGDLNMTRSILSIRNGKRIIATWDPMGGFVYFPKQSVGALYSDDDGGTWHHSNLVEVPPHTINDRDKSVRWQDGASEPTIVELNDGKLWMIIRTAQDKHYQSFSFDGGETWDSPEPSPFYGTLTNPNIGRLSDGRLLFLWNNSTPLPEFEKNRSTDPFIRYSASTGEGEDMFTNRDVIHGAISNDDGKTWQGFREICLNPRRNDGDYAVTGCKDQSVHQSQFVEVDSGRVIIALGQCERSRAIVVFNPNWLLEQKRYCDFSNGLNDWSVQGYQKGIRGHCALNRYESSILQTHPEDINRQVLKVYNNGRKDVIFPKGGATWNFHSGKQGYVEFKLMTCDDFGGIQINLLDRWVNPTDPSVDMLSQFNVKIDSTGTFLNTNTEIKISTKKWHTIRFSWNSIESGLSCEIVLDGKIVDIVSLKDESLHGISYIHFQSISADSDQGALIESICSETSNSTKL